MEPRTNDNASNVLKQIYGGVDIFVLLVLIVLFRVVLTYCLEEFVLTEDVYYKSYSRDLSDEQFSDMWDSMQKTKYVSYITSLVGFFIKIFSATVVLAVIVMAFGLEIRLRDSFKITLFAEMPSIVLECCKVVWFMSSPSYELEHVLNFYPLSMLSVANLDSPSTATRMIVGNFNITLLAQLTIICLLLATVLNLAPSKTAKIVGIGYSILILFISVLLFFIQVSLM